MNAKDYRRMNAQLLAREVGSVSSLARLAGTAQSYLSQIIGPRGKRDMGDDLARRLEYVTGKPHGWIDQPHIEDATINKARAIYEHLLTYSKDKLDAITLLLGIVDADTDTLGNIDIQGAAKVAKSDRVTDLGREQIAQRNKTSHTSGKRPTSKPARRNAAKG